MNKAPIIIVDADALVAISSKTDANHEKAKQILEYLNVNQIQILFPLTAICEAVTVLRGRLNRPDEAAIIMKKCQSGEFPLQDVTQAIFFEAAKRYNPQASKKNTPFDAVIAATAKKMNATAIFSFDDWYTKLGFTLAADLLPEQKNAA